MKTYFLFLSIEVSIKSDRYALYVKVRWIDTIYELLDYVALSKADINKIIVLHTSNTSFNLVRNRALLMNYV